MPLYTITSGDCALTAATAKTVCSYLAASTRRVKVRGIRVSGASTTATDGPVLVEIITGNTTQGTGSGSPFARPIDPAEPAALGTPLINHTVEPSAGTAITHFAERLTPIGGLLVYDFPPDQRPTAAVSTAVTLRLTSPATLSNVRAELVIDE